MAIKSVVFTKVASVKQPPKWHLILFSSLKSNTFYLLHENLMVQSNELWSETDKLLSINPKNYQRILAFLLH